MGSESIFHPPSSRKTKTYLENSTLTPFFVNWFDIETDATGFVPGEGNLRVNDIKVDPLVFGVGFGKVFATNP